MAGKSKRYGANAVDSKCLSPLDIAGRNGQFLFPDWPSVSSLCSISCHIAYTSSSNGPKEGDLVMEIISLLLHCIALRCDVMRCDIFEDMSVHMCMSFT